MTQKDNPFYLLAQSSEKKDIDSKFVQTLEAMLFLHEDSVHLINSRYAKDIKVSFDYSHGTPEWLYEKKKNNLAQETFEDDFSYSDDSLGTSLGQLLKNKLQIQSKQNTKKAEHYIVKEEFNFGEFLLNKLSQNLRRIYSAHRNKGQSKYGASYVSSSNTPLEQLNEQQNNIYKCFELISPHLKFDDTIRVFDRLFMGVSKNCTDATAFFYMALHEHLLAENEQRHLNIFKQCFDLKNVEPSIVKDIKNLNYPLNKQKFIQSSLKMLPDDFYISLNFEECSHGKGAIIVDILSHCAQQNVPLDKKSKLSLLSSALNPNGFLNKQPAPVGKKLALNIADYLKDVEHKEICSRAIAPEHVHKRASCELALELTPQLNMSALAVRALTVKCEPLQQQAILSRYDFSNQEIVLNIAKTITSQVSGEIRKITIRDFVSHVSNELENSTLGSILALDSDYIEVLKPIYMNRKLNKQLSNKTSSNTLTKKHKV